MHLPGLSMRTHSLAKGLQHNTYTIHGLLQNALLFISTDAFSLSRSLSYCLSFSFPRRKGGYKYGEVNRLPSLIPPHSVL